MKPPTVKRVWFYMSKNALIVVLALAVWSEVHGQFRKFYTLEDSNEYDTVCFELHATSGTSFIRNVKGGNALNIFGNPDLEKINPKYKAEQKAGAMMVNLDLKEFKESGLGHGIAYAMLTSKEEDSENYWKVLLNDKKTYMLDLNYGIGSSDIDLSGTSIKKLKLKTGSADVLVNYSDKIMNYTEMDTFMVKVDLGSIVARDMELARAKHVIAEIGFGQALLDFSGAMEEACTVKASVGAGKLEVVLPNNVPVKVNLSGSPLCGVSMVEGIDEVEKNSYANRFYSPYADNLLTFNIDVTMGTVNFVYAETEQ